jgi:hypothetical protein
MTHPEDWKQADVDNFYRWVSNHPAFRVHVQDEHPNLVRELVDQGLEQKDADELANYLKWLRVLPYADSTIGRDLLVFNYTQLKTISRRIGRSRRGKKLCSLFPVLARMMFHGVSTFPRNSARLAKALMTCLRQYPTGAKRFEPLAELLVDFWGGFLHGFNANELPREQLNLLIQSEHQRRAGSFEDLYVAEVKYEGYKKRVMEAREYLNDFRILKMQFRRVFKPGVRILRSDLAEKCGSSPPHTQEPDSGFQEAFDFFCWKWFLDGVEGDEPMVTKLSFDITPFGTSVFVPGYWSFDPSRDIKWKQLKAFHESRGAVKRQGKAFEPNRRNRQTKERLILEAAEESRARGERGNTMIQSIIDKVGLVPNTPSAYIYRLIREAKQKKERRPQ